MSSVCLHDLDLLRLQLLIECLIVHLRPPPLFPVWHLLRQPWTIGPVMFRHRWQVCLNPSHLFGQRQSCMQPTQNPAPKGKGQKKENDWEISTAATSRAYLGLLRRLAPCRHLALQLYRWELPVLLLLPLRPLQPAAPAFALVPPSDTGTCFSQQPSRVSSVYQRWGPYHTSLQNEGVLMLRAATNTACRTKMVELDFALITAECHSRCSCTCKGDAHTARVAAQCLPTAPFPTADHAT